MKHNSPNCKSWISLTQFLPVILLALVTVSPARAAVVTVTNNADSGPGSLRQAIENSGAGDVIQFDMTRVSSPITLTSGGLTLSHDLTITGPGAAQLAVRGGNTVRVFFIEAELTVSMSGLTISAGRFTGAGSIGANGGGGIYNDHGTLNLTSCIITGNSANSGNCASNGGSGGGIYNDHGVLTITKCGITANNANFNGNGTLNGGSGGGIYNDNGTLNVSESTFSGNTATVDGGAIYNDNGQLTMTASTVNGNSASADAGGLHNWHGTASLANCTFAGNHTAFGGAMVNAGRLNLTSCTLAGNGADAAGGVYNFGTAASAKLMLQNVLLAANTPQSLVNDGGTIESLGHNMSSDAAGGNGGTEAGGFLDAVGDTRNTDALLDPRGLQNNGGNTLTIAPQPGSPAIDAGKSSLTTDQRGEPRPADFGGIPNAGEGNGSDIGAFEVQLLLSISGRIYNSSGAGIGGVTISRTGGESVRTNSAGYYSFANLVSGSYTLIPSLSGYAFSPSSRIVALNSANVGGQNFIGGTPYRITGRIAASSGAAMVNVGVTLTGPGTVTTATNSAGYYSFVVPNGTFTVTPAQSGFSFTPSARQVVVNGADLGGQNFVGFATPP